MLRQTFGLVDFDQAGQRATAGCQHAAAQLGLLACAAILRGHYRITGSCLKTNLAPGATAKTDGWSGYPGAPSVNHDPHVVGNMAVHYYVIDGASAQEIVSPEGMPELSCPNRHHPSAPGFL